MKKIIALLALLLCTGSLQLYCARYKITNKTKYDLRIQLDVAYGLDKEIIVHSQEEEEVDTGPLRITRGYRVYAAIDNREEEVLNVRNSRFSSVSCTIFTEDVESSHSDSKHIKFYGTENEVIDGSDIFVERCSVNRNKKKNQHE